MITLRTRYLEGKKCVETSSILDVMLSVPGELRPSNKDVLENSIVGGVSGGEFGLGEIKDGMPTVKFFKEFPMVSFEQGEVLIQASLCKNEQDGDDRPENTHENDRTNDDEEPDSEEGIVEALLKKPKLDFTFNVPEGQVNDISQMLLNITKHYRKIQLHVIADDGGMSPHDVNMIKETLRQIGATSDLE